MSSVSGSKRLSWLLRHGARESGLPMDEAGWAPLARVLTLCGLDEHELDAVIRDNNKARFQRVGDRVRATQGHSLEGTPVTLEGLEASWEIWQGSSLLWHGTTVEACKSIAETGVLPMARSHVHLAETPESRVGKRAGVAVLLGVDPIVLRERELPVFRSPNGVILVREVPPSSVVSLRCLTKRARRAEADLRALQWPALTS